ncbi:MAG: hypothetical protein ACRDHF_02050 [Tepidiformaceae bacterium]
MASSILRRGGAWRFAALGLFAASILSFGLNGSDGPEPAKAHVGLPQTLCGSENLIAAFYLGQFTVYEAPYFFHFHEWEFPGPTHHDELCGILW